tara:strand:+ start:66 stop:515 length:450 start_codon:yes stop_codon:yes gene_type:complete
MQSISFNLDNPQWKKAFPEYKKIISNAVKKTFQSENVSVQGNHISIFLTSDDNIKNLNLKFRNKNKATNVLAFPIQEFIEKKNYIGDLAISLDKIIFESNKYKIKKNKYLSKIIIHGILHLLGYDHINDNDYEVMNKIEERIIKELYCN